MALDPQQRKNSMLEIGISSPGKASPSQELTIQRILGSLSKPNIRRLGVVGDEGAGKSWIMRHVIHRVRETHLFEIAILLTESAFLVAGKAQEIIAKSLGLTVDEYSQLGFDAFAALAISARLEKAKVLIVVDKSAVSDDDLLMIITAGVQEQNNDLKFVFVGLDVPGRQKVDREIWVCGLPRDEAITLFQEKAIGGSLLSPQIQSLAEEAAIKCGGLPLKILIAGAALINGKSDFLWGKDVKGLTEEEDGRHREMRPCIDLALGCIKTSEVRNCLDYCSLLPGGFDFDIKEMIECWMMEGLLGQIELFIPQAYRKGLAVFEELIDRCLLERVSNNYVNVHPSVYSCLQRQSSRTHIVSDLDLFGKVDKLKTFTKISLIGAKIDERRESLPHRPNCPNLSTLFLTGNFLSEGIPHPFFEGMPNLCVLDLSETMIKSLPSSLSVLNNLRALILRRCNFLTTLSPLPVLEKLEVLLLPGCKRLTELPDSFFQHMKALRILDLSSTQFTRLPTEASPRIEMLDLSSSSINMFPYEILASPHLRHLDLSNTTGIKVVEWEKIHRLPKRLDLGQSHSWKDRLGESEGARIHVSDATFFRSLENSNPLWETSLLRFSFHVVTPSEDLPEHSDAYFQSTGFQYRDIYFKAKYFSSSTSRDRCLEICHGNSFPHGITAVLNHAELLSIHCNRFVTQILDFGVENMMNLRTIIIERCHEMATVFGAEKQNDRVLECLENLWVSNLANIKNVWEGLVTRGSFIHLKHLYLDCCPNLVNVFSRGSVLESLEHLEIKFCDKLEALYGEELIDEYAFPRLHTLCLWELPKLKIICRGALPALEMLTVRACYELKELPLGDRISNALLKIRGELKWWEALRWRWRDEGVKSRLRFNKWDHF